MSEPRALPATVAPVLRVVSGRLEGKEYPLPTDRRICIGHGLANDVVLRGLGTRDGAVALELNGEAATLHVLSGSIELLGRTFGEGEEAVLPPYLPFRFGEHHLAHGARESTRWGDAVAVAASAASPSVPLHAPRLQDRVERIGHGWIVRARERVTTFHVAASTAALVLLIVLGGPAADLLSDQVNGPAQLESSYARAGFDTLEVERNPTGGLIVTGDVESEADLIRVREIANGVARPVIVDVTSAASLANAAVDILAAQGVDAAAEPAGIGGIAVVAPYLPADQQQMLRDLLVRDLPSLRRVRFQLDDRRGESPLQILFANSGTGLATVIADPGHIVTADGSRWFPGAVLPSGHRLISVAPGRVRFEKDGRVEEVHL